MNSDNYVVKYFPLPGGRLCEKGEGEARGYDVFCPYLITGPEMDPDAPYRRKVLWDFSDPDQLKVPLPEKIRNNIEFRKVGERHQWVYVMPPKNGYEVAEVHIGLGVIFAMTPGWACEICRRSGEAGKKMNALSFPANLLSSVPEMPDIADWYQSVPVDSGFQGEAMTLLQNYGAKEFVIHHGKRITQIKFEGPGGNFYPVFEQMPDLSDLRVTERGAKSHNSTGTGNLKKDTIRIQLPVLPG